MDGIGRIYQRVRLSGRDWLGVCIVVIFALSQIAFFEQPLLGVCANAAVFIALLAFALWKRESQELMLSVLVLPMSLLISLSFPHMSSIAQSVLFYGSLLCLSVFYRFVFASQRALNGRALWQHVRADSPPAIVVGVSLGLVACQLHVRNTFAHTPFGFVALIIIVTAITEELLFRGLIQERASRYMRPVAAAVLSAFLYALFHSGTGSTSGLLFGLVSGGALSALYYAKPHVALTMTANTLMKFAYIGFLMLY